MSLLTDISRFRTPGSANGEYTVQRHGLPTWVDGEEQPGTPTSFTIVASVQPYAAGRHSVTIPEGVRTEDVRQLWTATELHVNDATSTPDIVLVPGGLSLPVEPFYVYQVTGPWTMSGRTHYIVGVARRRKP